MAGDKARLVAALCSLIVLAAFIDSTQSASCCLRYSRRPIPCKRLLGYTVQTINTSCDINAIIFHVPGRFVCADPAMNWTKRGVKCVEDMRRKMEEIMENGTSVATTSS
ncbi:C-C motif chemokine 20b [Parambassis ranga]|uniref:C-C motif chemokine n=1 Tax=Parambassis ranga TaxID=210632 RepID=A0A6P7KGI8_9TELE|nr:C-C motif chemokine 20-like [Parambassis ranga]